MRNALARTLYELAKEDERIVVLVADISPAGAMEDFRREFPRRFYNLGVAEQSMVGLAAGLAMRGFRPFCYTIATFALFRPYEFIRCDLAYQNLPVTVVGMGAGLSYSTLGGTHQAIEDVAAAMACPNLTVLAPCDPAETAACARWCAARESGGPVYMRIGKAGEEDLTRGLPAWEFGKTRLLYVSKGSLSVRDACVVLSYGPISSMAVEVASMLDADAYAVSTLSSDNPFNGIDVGDYARAVVIEEASGAPLASALRMAYPMLGIESFALPRNFPHIYGTRAELLDAVGLSVDKIIVATFNGGEDAER